MLEALGQSFGMLASWSVIGALLAGTAIGAAAALLPGFGGITAMAILLPLTFTMDLPEAMVFLVGIMAASGFAGSVTSILLNLPGEGINAATVMDGYPMARQGRAGVALGAAAAASGLGAIVGLLILGLSLPLIRSVLLFFGPGEMFAVTMAGVALIATVSYGSVLRGLVAGGFGLLIGAVGLNVVVGGARFTFGVTRLLDGIPLVPAIVGLFALPELYLLMRQNRTISQTGSAVKGGTLQGVLEVLRRPALFLRSSLIGTGVGILPGVGGAVAGWIAYFAAMNTSKHPESFGRGNVEGVIAPEAANDSKEGGSMMPLLALGIPGSLSTALLLSAFLIHGINPGQRMFDQNLDLIWLMIVGMVIANICTSVIGLSIANLLVKLTLIPVSIIAPIILSLAIIGPYLSARAYYAIVIALCFGAVGLLMKKLGYPRPPLLVGLVLFPIAETNFHSAYQISRRSFVFLADPVIIGILVVTVLAVVVPAIRRHTRGRRGDRQQAPARRVMASRGSDAEAARPPGEEGGVRASAPGGPQGAPDPPGEDDLPTRRALLSEVAFLALGAGVLVTFFVDSFRYQPLARLFPLVVVVATALAVAAQAIVTARRLRAAGGAEPAAGAAEGYAKGPYEVAAWILGILVAYWTLGMVVGTAVYIAAFNLGFERRRPTPRRVASAAVFALGGWLFAAYLVEGVMGVRLPAGWLL